MSEVRPGQFIAAATCQTQPSTRTRDYCLTHAEHLLVSAKTCSRAGKADYPMQLELRKQAHARSRPLVVEMTCCGLRVGFEPNGDARCFCCDRRWRVTEVTDQPQNDQPPEPDDDRDDPGYDENRKAGTSSRPSPGKFDLGRRPLRRQPNNQANLPDGKTCGDCIFISKCHSMFGHQSSDEVCDWAPSRFKEATHVLR